MSTAGSQYVRAGPSNDETVKHGRAISAFGLPPNISAISAVGDALTESGKAGSVFAKLSPEESHLSISKLEGFKRNTEKDIIHYICCVLFNILYVLYWSWFHRSYLYTRYDEVSDISDAEFLLITDEQKRETFCEIEVLREIARHEEDDVAQDPSYLQSKHAGDSAAASILGHELGRDVRPMDVHPTQRMFVYRNRRYIYSPVTNSFELLQAPTKMDSYALLRKADGHGLTLHERVGLRRIFGRNAMFIPMQSIPRMLIEEILHPFFVFQTYSVILWMFENYFVFASVVAAMALFSIIDTITSTRSNINRLRTLARVSVEVRVVRGRREFLDAHEQIANPLAGADGWVDPAALYGPARAPIPVDISDLVVDTVSSTELVPGDVILLDERGDVPCDLVLLMGSVVVNESMLTGESVPVVKVPITDSIAAPGESTPSTPQSNYTMAGTPQTPLLAPQTLSSTKHSSLKSAPSPSTAFPSLFSQSHPAGHQPKSTKPTTPIAPSTPGPRSPSPSSSGVPIPIGKDPRVTLFAGSRIMQLKPPLLRSDPLSSSPSTSTSSSSLASLERSESKIASPKTGGILAMVASTGFATTKGNMVSSMLFPPKTTFKFEQQSFRFVGILFGVAFIGFGIAVWRYYLLNAAPGLIATRALDLVTIVVPPSLPLAMTVGIAYSLVALRKEKIFCIAPSRVNYAGKIKLMCFDKTGTLTSDSLQFRGIHSFVQSTAGAVRHRGMSQMEINRRSTATSAHNDFIFDPSFLPTPIRSCLAACHSLVMLDGDFIGDPLEVEAFRAARATYIEARTGHGIAFHTALTIQEGQLSEGKIEYRSPAAHVIPEGDEDKDTSDNVNPINSAGSRNASFSSSSSSPLRKPHSQTRKATGVEWSIAKVFPFEPKLQRMSVLAIDDATGQAVIHAKGAPEMIASLCDPSTVPANFAELVDRYTRDGYRVIALAKRGFTIAEEASSSTTVSGGVDSTDVALGTPAFVTDSSVGQTKYLTRHQLDRRIAAVGAETARLDFEQLRLSAEKDLELLGLLVMENALKKETVPTLQVLKDAGIRSVMVTGDNAKTAISIAKESGIVPRDFAVFVGSVTKPGKEQLASLKAAYKARSPSSNHYVAGNNTMASGGSVTEVGASIFAGTVISGTSNRGNESSLDEDKRDANIVTPLVVEELKATSSSNTRSNTPPPSEDQDDNIDWRTLMSVTDISWVHSDDPSITLDPFTFSVRYSLPDGTFSSQPPTAAQLALASRALARSPSSSTTASRSTIVSPLSSPSLGNTTNKSPSSPQAPVGLSPSALSSPSSLNTLTHTIVGKYELAVTGDAFAVLQADHERAIQTRAAASEAERQAVLALGAPKSTGPKQLRSSVMERAHNGGSSDSCNSSSSSSSSSDGVDGSMFAGEVNGKDFGSAEAATSASNQAVLDGALVRKSSAFSGAAAARAGADQSDVQKVAAPSVTSITADWVPLNSVDEASLLQRVAVAGAIFARMTPDQKASLVNVYQRLGLYTGMCGDGANDCAALKAAHAGVSLAESEASIAAPFTSLTPNISCIPILLCEGRSSLKTSFQLFRYMALFSFIQFTSAICLYFQGGNYCDYQYLYQDLFVIFPLVILLGRTPAARTLTKKRPSGNLLSITNLSTVFVHMMTALTLHIIIYIYSSRQSGYVIDTTEEWFCAMWEATSLQYFACLEYTFFAWLFANGHPWKKPFYYNTGLTLYLVATYVCTLAFFFFGPWTNFFITADDMAITNTTWKVTIVCIHLCQIVFCCLVEFVIAPFARSVYDHQRKSIRTNTVFGNGSKLLKEGAKPYHMLRRVFEDTWPTNQSTVSSSALDELTKKPTSHQPLLAATA